MEEIAPAAPQPKRTEIRAHPKDRVVATKIRVLSAKTGECQTTTGAIPGQWATEKATGTGTVQMKVLTDLVKSLMKAMEEQKQAHANQIETLVAQIETLKTQLADMSTQVTDLREEFRTQITSIQASSPSPSYAEVARTPPNSLPSNVQTLTSMGTTLSTMTDTLYCTIDISRVREEEKSKAQPGAVRKAIEEAIRAMEGQENWRCAAVIRDSRTTERIRVACRDEAELQRVKEAAQKTVPANTRVLRDQLYPVKVDNANRTAIFDQEGNILPGAAEVLGKENHPSIAKIAWLSRKDTGKAYGSMVVYVTKGSEAARLLQEQFFHVAGESAYTRIYEHRVGPTQCYNCQEVGHKAYACTKAQICAKCAKEGHSHKDCPESIAKCALCKGPHESFSKNCRVLHGTQAEK